MDNKNAQKKQKVQGQERKFEDFPAVRTYGADLFQRYEDGDKDEEPEDEDEP